jgi:hypothetical protein
MDVDVDRVERHVDEQVHLRGASVERELGIAEIPCADMCVRHP